MASRSRSIAKRARCACVDAVQVVDVGTIVSPLGHQGQLEGGFAFGLGAGLMEDLAVTTAR